jgi:hypothetical protein
MWAIVRDIQCKKCHYRGLAEDQGMDDCPPHRIFKPLGKNAKGKLHFKCPSCNTVAAYSPYSFIHPVIRIIFFAIITTMIWAVIKWIAK